MVERMPARIVRFIAFLPVVSSLLLGGEKQTVAFRSKGIDLKVVVTASVEDHGGARALSVDLIPEDACELCIPGPLDFEVSVQAGGNTQVLPIRIDRGEVSGYGEMQIGATDVKEFTLRLVHGFMRHPVKTKLYEGIVAEDDKCMRDALDALALGGGAGRKALLELIGVGCVHTTNTAMSVPATLAKVHLVRGKRIGYAYLFPIMLDNPDAVLKGLILADNLKDGVAEEGLEISDVSAPGPISITP